MKKPFTAFYLLMLTLISVSTGLKSQDPLSGAAVERLQIYTDRTMFISGEKILFSAIIFNENNILTNEYSRVLYCELITPEGNRITGGKYLIENSSGQGCLQIPEETITGIYYLKSYTRFMRNGGPDGYHFIMLKIINPYKAEVLTGHEVDDTSYSPEKGMNEQYPDLPLSISSDKKKYSTRENITLKITGNKGKGLPVKLCLSVIPEMANGGKTLTGKMTITSSGGLQYLPETRGISLTGRLLENETGRPIPRAIVNLSIIGDKDIMAIRTDSSGQYFFALPDFIGNRDIFLCAEEIPGNSPAIYIENDFCSRPVNLPSPVFHLTEKEKETAYDLAVNQKITSIFRNDSVSGKPKSPQNGKPFYGDPTEILVMENYIDLPTMEEYFNELPVAVKVRKSQGRKHFRFYTTRAEMTIYDPLVLIDWVAVDDIDRVLAMSPREIDRIELVNSPYVKGNITYGGIISFVSKKNDFAGIDLPSSGTFINYRFLEECSENVPAGPFRINLPDSRNTIYWDPDVQTNDNGSTDIFFTAPDTPGKYIILLSGIGESGKDVIVREEFEVIAY
jgi:hypothetical protein